MAVSVPNTFTANTKILSAQVNANNTALLALCPISALGDLVYASSGSAMSRLAGNTTTTRKFLTQTGNGTVSAAPSWESIATSDLTSASAASVTTQSVSSTSYSFVVTSSSTGAGNIMRTGGPLYSHSNGVSYGSRWNNTALSLATAGGSTSASVSVPFYRFTGTSTQNFTLPDATTLVEGWQYTVVNDSTGAVTVKYNGGTNLQVMAANTRATFTCTDVSTSDGTWTIDYRTVYPLTAAGDLFVGGTSGAPSRLAAGSDGQALTLSSGTPAWSSTLSNVSTLSNTAGVAVKGTNTNDSAAAGYVGQYTELTATATNFPTTDTYGDFASSSISLTAGDWDVTFVLLFDRNSAGGFTNARAGISTTTGNSATGLTSGTTLLQTTTAAAGTLDNGSMTIASLRVSLSGTTTYYGKVRATYSSGTPQYTGRLSARRVR